MEASSSSKERWAGREMPAQDAGASGLDGLSGGFPILHALAMAMIEGDEVGGKFEELCSDGALGGDLEGVIEDEADAALVGGVVEVGDAAGDEVAGDVGVAELIVAVVAFADDGGEGGVQDAAFDGPVPMRK